MPIFRLLGLCETRHVRFDGEEVHGSDQQRQLELFDLRTDPNEKQDLHAPFLEKTVELEKRWVEHQKQAKAPESSPKSRDFVASRN